MNYKLQFKNICNIIAKTFRYNLKIMFANWFFIFLLIAIAIFLIWTILTLVNSDSNPTEGSVYTLLYFTGILLIAYPTIFGIQNDVDSRMIEILFGIPNYRYKVWLVRLGIIYLVVFGMLMILCFLCSITMVTVPVVDMVFQLMFPIFFLGCLAFMFSTIIRDGFGTGVVMIIIVVIFLFINEVLPPQFRLFMNPFTVPSDVNEAVWAEATFNNRIYLLIGMFINVLFGLLNLQKREKFV
jgi:hypothetical protein